MKSLSDLNAKWWYRLLKVLYGALFLLVLVFSAVMTYALNESYRTPDWKITCDYGNQTTFNAFHDKGISISDYDPDKAVPEDMDTQIKAACGITQADIQAAQNEANTKTAEARSKCTNNNPFFCDISYTATTYGIGATGVAVETPWEATGYTLLSIFIVAGIFEIGRRAFYYIALGKIKPPK